MKQNRSSNDLRLYINVVTNRTIYFDKLKTCCSISLLSILNVTDTTLTVDLFSVNTLQVERKSSRLAN